MHCSFTSVGGKASEIVNSSPTFQYLLKSLTRHGFYHYSLSLSTPSSSHMPPSPPNVSRHQVSFCKYFLHVYKHMHSSSCLRHVSELNKWGFCPHQAYPHVLTSIPLFWSLLHTSLVKSPPSQITSNMRLLPTGHAHRVKTTAMLAWLHYKLVAKDIKWALTGSH